ncbi:glycosyltransferase [Seonamhaeicola sediminis]|uniref:Glycosyltransferase n=1 Tax=Seonamhaeicola sediminis TaxID=2528206 RepID=A0A562YHR9_9FLAO|nr:glycosyltransferase [Seonamhaeicola sediminis]TWO34308.1 glycosyltransferase [Seonamhaeicola sediminis]
MSLLDFVYYAFFSVVSIQVVIYIVLFGKFSFSKQKKQSAKKIAVSVIVCAKNEAKNLKTFLPSIISQEYPDFEIVLINDASTDNTLKVMEAFKKEYNNIKIVDVKNVEAFWGNKKYALTLGIKASKNDYLLFTDADCKPVSKYWIKDMTAHFSNQRTIVLGYGAYSKIKNSLLNKLVRFETLVTAIQYFSFAKLGIPYMGVGRNLAYAKKEFFDANGFINHIQVRSGDDDLFINQVASKNNTAICYSKHSFTESIPKTTFKDWFKQKRRHISTAKLYKVKHKLLLSIIYTFTLLFWVLALILLPTLFNWRIVIILFFSRIFVQYLVYGFSAKKLDEKDLLRILPFLEFFLVFTQLVIFINNLISKPNHWK